MISIKDLQNLNVGILGFGMEGRAVANYLIQNGISPVIFERTSLEDLHPESKEIIAEHNLAFNSGDNYLSMLNSVSVVFRSPGISDSAFREYLAPEAIVTTQTKFFFDHCPSKIIGITGTKGKGTTSSLVATMLQLSDNENRTTYLTGNIGKIQPLEFLDKLRPTDLVVYELSSFQLQDLTVSPHIGICLMVTADHLDYHSDLGEYHQAKAAISQYQSEDDFCIFNLDYPASVSIGQKGSGAKWGVSSKVKPENGVLVSGDELQFADEVIDISNRKLPGLHNRENIAAAVTACKLLRVPMDHIIQTINEFAGLPHRLQLVANISGVSYYDDSISTTPDTAIAAIRAFSQTVIMIVGGYDKGLNYDELLVALKNEANVKAVVALGETGSDIVRILKEQNFDKPLSGPFFDLSQAVTAAKKYAVHGDNVVLSPGFASFGMFKNYQDRGDQFSVIVKS